MSEFDLTKPQSRAEKILGKMTKDYSGVDVNITCTPAINELDIEDKYVEPPRPPRPSEPN